MAQPTYTLTALSSAAQHAIGGTPSAQTTLTEIVNNALQYLCRAHQWKWRRRTKSIDFTATAITSLARVSNVLTVTKNSHGLSAGDSVRIFGASDGFNGSFVIASVTTNTFTVNQTDSDATAAAPGSYIPGHVALPADFEQMLSLAPSSQTISWTPADIDEINQARQSNIYGFSGYLYDIGFSAQASVTAAATARLELYPIPQAAATDVARMVYLRTIDNLSAGTDLPDIPAYLHPVLKQLCREFATQDEDQDDWKLIEGSRADAMLNTAIAAEGLSKPVSGRMRSQLGCDPSTSAYPFPPQAISY